MTGWLLAISAVLVLVAGWSASAQAALARVSAAGDDRPRGASKLAADRLQAIVADPPRYLGILVFIRVICEAAAAVALTLAMTRWLGDDWRAFLLAFAVIILARYILVGVGPRAFGKQHAERISLTAAGILYPLARSLGPLPRLLASANSKLPLGRRDPDDALTAPPELRGLVDFIERRNAIEPGEREMVRSVFELGDTIVREVMVPRTDMVFIERDKTIGQAMSLALRSGFSRIPVVGESTDDVVGIAYLKDMASWNRDHPGAEATHKVSEIMRSATFVPESKPVDELLRQMQAERIHVAVVIDEYGGTAGLVTIEDILEEIVGEIADEYDNERAPVEWLSEDAARVTARLPLADLEDLFDVTVEAEDVETVGGLMAHELGRVPIAGAEATIQGLHLTAENVAGRRNKLGTVLIERIKDKSPQE